MKNPITLIALLGMLSLFSCSKVIYTNEQVMNDFKTKESIVKKFGMPDEKRTGELGEEWLYKYHQHNSFTDHSITQYPNTNSINVINFGMYKRYIIFNMDLHGNVLGWQCVGVDFTKRKAAPGKTIALVVGSVGLVIVLTTILVRSNDLFSPGYNIGF
jgi:hypothetical protein